MNNRRILFLASYHPKYMQPLKRWGALLSLQGYDVTQMYPDAYYKDDVLDELGKEYDVVVYFGHGMPQAWSSYGFISTNDLKRLNSRKPKTVMLSLSCYSLNAEHGTSLGEMFINHFLARTVVGYETTVKYQKNLQALNQLFAVLFGNGKGIFDALQTIETDLPSTSLQVLSIDSKEKA